MQTQNNTSLETEWADEENYISYTDLERSTNKLVTEVLVYHITKTCLYNFDALNPSFI